MMTLLLSISTIILSTMIMGPSFARGQYTEITLEDFVQEEGPLPSLIVLEQSFQTEALEETEPSIWEESQSERVTDDIEEQSEPEWPYDYIGNFKLTFYCPCRKCTGKGDGITYTGTIATEGRTIAVDKNYIPLGSHVLIVWPDGSYHEYIAEDTGVKGMKIDVFLDDHNRCLKRGIEHAEVYVRK